MNEPTLLKRAVNILIDNDILDAEGFIKELSKNKISLLGEEIELLLGLDKGTLELKREEGSVSNLRLQLMCDSHPYDITKMLHQLAESNYLIVNGYGKGKVYYINNDFLNEDKEIDLTEDEAKVIKEKVYITNKISREDLYFSKDRSISLFNSLIKKQFICKKGSGNKVEYILYR